MRYDGDWHELFSRQGITEIVTLCRHNGEIWFGATSLRDGASLWRGDGQHFEMAGQWPRFFSVAALASFDGKLFCSLVPSTKSETAAPVLIFDGQWNDVLNDHPYQCIYDLHPHKKHLCGGTVGAGWFGGHVIDILSGRVIGGDGNNGSWNHQSTILRLCSLGDTLIATGNREPAAAGNHSNIWSYAGKAWKPVPLPPRGFQGLYSFNAVHPFRDHLIVGCGGRPAGQAAILCLSRDGWTQIGGTGLNNSWSPNVYRRMNAPLANGSQSDYVYNFCEHDGALIAGFGASPGCGQVWRFKPDSTA